MRAIKREKMEVKVLARLENMLATAEVEKKLDNEEKHYIEKKKLKTPEVAEMTEVPEDDSAPPPTGKCPDTIRLENPVSVTLILMQMKLPPWKWKVKSQKLANSKRSMSKH